LLQRHPRLAGASAVEITKFVQRLRASPDCRSCAFSRRSACRISTCFDPTPANGKSSRRSWRRQRKKGFPSAGRIEPLAASYSKLTSLLFSHGLRGFPHLGLDSSRHAGYKSARYWRWPRPRPGSAGRQPSAQIQLRKRKGSLMGKSPRLASAGIFVALFVASGCQNSAPPVAAQGVVGQQPWKAPATTGIYQTNNGTTGAMAQNGTSGTMNQNAGTGFSQAGSNTAALAQQSNNSANVRPQSGQSFGTNGSFQNNFANSGQQGSGFSQNPGGNTVQPAGFSPNQVGGGIQQTGWSQNSVAGGSAGNRNAARNLDENPTAPYDGSGIAASTPAPVWPKSSSSASGPNSNDPPAVAQPDVNYSTRYPQMPFTGGRAGNQ
jgi:hypothetical protein